MSVCKKCNENVSFFEVIDGVCRRCRNEPGTQPIDADVTEHDEALVDVFAKIHLSTEMLPASESAVRLGLVSGTCIYGQHLGKDIAAAWRDTLGGRARSIEKAYVDARNHALLDLRMDAHKLGADSVIAITFQHQEITGGGRSMAMVTAIGTAIRTC